jgi:hypothetical protein
MAFVSRERSGGAAEPQKCGDPRLVTCPETPILVLAHQAATPRVQVSINLEVQGDTGVFGEGQFAIAWPMAGSAGGATGVVALETSTKLRMKQAGISLTVAGGDGSPFSQTTLEPGQEILVRVQWKRAKEQRSRTPLQENRESQTPTAAPLRHNLDFRWEKTSRLRVVLVGETKPLGESEGKQGLFTKARALPNNGDSPVVKLSKTKKSVIATGRSGALGRSNNNLTQTRTVARRKVQQPSRRHKVTRESLGDNNVQQKSDPSLEAVTALGAREEALKAWITFKFSRQVALLSDLSSQAHSFSRRDSIIALERSRKLAATRHGFQMFFEPRRELMQNIAAEVAAGRIVVRKGIDVRNDVGVREEIIHTLLAYDPLWLRFGLELVLGTEHVPTELHDLKKFIATRVLSSEVLAADFQPLVTTRREEQVLHQSRVLDRHALTTLLTVVWVLDEAKRAKLLPGDPRLFVLEVPRSPRKEWPTYKSSKDVLVRFTQVRRLFSPDVFPPGQVC